MDVCCNLNKYANCGHLGEIFVETLRATRSIFVILTSSSIWRSFSSSQAQVSFGGKLFHLFSKQLTSLLYQFIVPFFFSRYWPFPPSPRGSFSIYSFYIFKLAIFYSIDKFGICTSRHYLIELFFLMYLTVIWCSWLFLWLFNMWCTYHSLLRSYTINWNMDFRKIIVVQRQEHQHY